MNVRSNIALSEEGFIFNPTTGDSFSTNKIGTEIIQALRRGMTVPDIVREWCGRYDVETSVFERDVDEFLTLLREYNITEEN